MRVAKSVIPLLVSCVQYVCVCVSSGKCHRHYLPKSYIILQGKLTCSSCVGKYVCVPVTRAWRVLRLRMEERPADMDVGCECIK